jgi:hypothetical protein
MVSPFEWKGGGKAMGVPYSIEGCRHVLAAVEAIHNLGYHRVRVVPHLADSAGGDRWWCWIVPAAMTSPDHGACFATPDPRPDSVAYAWFPVDAFWQSIDFPAPPGETAARILTDYPQIAVQGWGTDDSYVRWYSEMLRLTEPDGLIISSAFHDRQAPAWAEGLHVVGKRGGAEIVPLPPSWAGQVGHSGRAGCDRGSLTEQKGDHVERDQREPRHAQSPARPVNP